MGAFAWVTLATNDSYSLGALVLAHSLKQAHTAHQLAVLVTPGVTGAMREKLASVFNVVQEVNILDSRDEANLRLLKRPELGITFTKLHCWRLTQFEKCVFLDADTLVLQNADELFERDEFSAAPDVGWPDCFNSGVFVYRPSLDTYEKLIQFALEKGSFDGGDQGLLNMYFSDWAHKDISKHLPFIYNMCSTACYSYLPAFKQFGANAKIIHFIGVQKPWLQYFNTETKQVQPSGDSTHLQEVLQRWWDIFCSLIHPHLSPAMQGLSQHEMSPSYFPPQYDPPPNPTASADDYENAWDPWDEYDQKVAQNTHYTSYSTHYNQNQPIESLNTNASRVADHSQTQMHNFNVYSVQNDGFYQPPSSQVIVHDLLRAATPPPTPQPEYHNHPPQFHHSAEPQHQYHQEESQHHHFEPQNYQNEPQYPQQHHDESQYRHSEHQSQYSEPESGSHHSEYQPQHHESQNRHVEAPYHHQYQENRENSFPHIPERPRSPNSPTQIPILPKECEATTTVSNDMSLSSTIEDSGNREDAGLAGAFSQLTLGVPRTPQQDALENVLRKQAWEVGNIDYLGKDSFTNIWSKITETLSSGPPGSEPVAPAPQPEAPLAPAESQSQTAPQEEATSVQPPTPPVGTPIDIKSSVETPKVDFSEHGPPVEANKETGTEPTVTNLDTAKEISPAIPAEPKPDAPEKPVVESQAIVMKQIPTSEAKALEPESSQLPSETVSTPSPKEPEKTDSAPVSTDLVQPEAPEPINAAISPQESVADPQLPVEPTTVDSSSTPTQSTPATEPVIAVGSIGTSVSAVDISQTKPDSSKVAEVLPVAPEVLAPKPAEPAVKPIAATAELEAKPVAPEVLAPKPAEPTAKPIAATAELEAKPVAPEVLAPKHAEPSTKPIAATAELEAKPAILELDASNVEPAPADVCLKSGATQSVESSAKPDESVVSREANSNSAKPPAAAAAAAATTTTTAPPDASVAKPKEAAPVADPGASPKTSPKTKVTEATPPVTPGTPPVEKTKQALTAEANAPATPPPAEGGSAPTPPPRKTDKPKKAAAKPKK